MAAFGKVIITPEDTTPLQGYDPNRYIADPTCDIVDDLFAKIAILDDGNQRIIMIGVDSCLISEVPFQAIDPSGKGGSNRVLTNSFPLGTVKLWAEAGGTAEELTTVMATHTHSAPVHFNDKYTSRIAVRISELVELLRPVSISVVVGNCTITANRRPFLQPNHDLQIDRTLGLAIFHGEDGKPLGGLVNCAVHPTVLLHPINRVSGDIIGVAMSKLEKHLGDEVVCLFAQGFSGDICSAGHDRRKKEDTYPLVQSIGSELYEDILRIMKDIQPAACIPLNVSEVIVSLPTRDNYYKLTNDVIVRGIRIGELAILTVSAEVFNGYVVQFGRMHDFRFLFCVGVANGYSGYIPTAEAYNDNLGGYEMNTTTFNKSASGMLISTATKVLAELKMM